MYGKGDCQRLGGIVTGETNFGIEYQHLGGMWQNSGYGELLGFEEMGFGIYKMLVYIRALAFLNKTKVFVFVVPFRKGGEIPIDTGD